MPGTDAEELAKLQQQFSNLQRKFEEQNKKFAAVELAQRAAEDDARRAKEELEARRQVNSDVLEKRVEEAVLKAQAGEVAKRRKAEQELDRLRADLAASEKNGKALSAKLASIMEQIKQHEQKYKDWAKQEVQKYKTAAKAAWRGAEEEVANLEQEIVSLREQNEKLLTRMESQPGSVAPSEPVRLKRMSNVSEYQGKSSARRERPRADKERLDEVYDPFTAAASTGEMEVLTLDDAPVGQGIGSKAKSVAPKKKDESIFDHLEKVEKTEESRSALNAMLNPTKSLDLGESVVEQNDEEELDDGIEDGFQVELPGAAPAVPIEPVAPPKKQVEMEESAELTAPSVVNLDDFTAISDDKPAAVKRGSGFELEEPQDIKLPAKKGGFLKWFFILILLMAMSGGLAYAYLMGFLDQVPIVSDFIK